ncbi:lipid-binding SYLF domain-containing protein [Flavobacterium jejuense]|uniref:lipid-binding SYLF domain-containing protein n=1 Tax=Flavobacterium jejuense TaxID=1544455 RepID=UPI001AA09401|nr:lipid-binding SYLF domain-containing protein [Flavobacterium jejuense]
MNASKFWKAPLIMSAIFLLTSAIKSDKETERINKSAKVLVDISKMEESIPHELMVHYEAVIVIPKLLNLGFGVGGKRGRGIALVKLPNGKWSNPVFITLTGGSVGFQAGVQSVDLVLVFKNKGILTKVNNGDLLLVAIYL